MNTGWNYCPQCGAGVTTRHAEGRERRYCPDCERLFYRNPKPCAGVFVVEGPQVLFVQRTEPPGVGTWSLPAGYLEGDEPPRRAAVRELAEETGVETTYETIGLIDTVFVEHPDGRHILVVVYAVERAETTGNPIAGSDADAARFWTLEELRQEDETIEPGYEPIIQRITREQDY